jgi:aminopeptidase N
MLYRLAVLGEASAADIDAELARDPSAVGREGAARCRAALPTKEAKAAAWEAMFHDDSLSNYLFTADAQGFWQPEHLGVTGPYVERYFAEAPGFAARRGPVLAELAGKSAFPAPAVAPATLALARACLASPGLHPAFHRALTDQTSDLTRILHLRRTS